MWLVVLSSRHRFVEPIEGLRPRDPVNLQMPAALKTDDRLLGTGSEPAVRRTRPIAGSRQLMLQSAHCR